jgi:hypothetical protein
VLCDVLVFFQLMNQFRTTSEVSSISYCSYLLKQSNLPIQNWQKPSENDSSQQQQHTNKKQAVFAQVSYLSDYGKESKSLPVHNGNGIIQEQFKRKSRKLQDAIKR